MLCGEHALSLWSRGGLGDRHVGSLLLLFSCAYVCSIDARVDSLLKTTDEVVSKLEEE